MQSEEFKKLKVSGSQLSNINTFKPELIPEPIPEEKEELMGDDDDLTKSSLGSSFGRDEEEEEERMNDDDEEEEEEEEEKPDAFEDNQVFLADEYDKEKEYSGDERELFKQAKKMKDRKLKKQLAEYNKKFHPVQKI